MTFEEWYEVNLGAGTNEEFDVAKRAWNSAIEQHEQLAQRLKVAEHRVLVAEARFERAVKIISHIYSFVTPEDVRLPDGRVFRFNDPRGEGEMLRGLSEAIRAVPEEINKLDQ